MSTGSRESHSLRSRIHAQTPTRFAAGFTLRSPNFFPPSQGACLQAGYALTHTILFIQLLNSNQEFLAKETSSLKCDPYVLFDNLSTQ